VIGVPELELTRGASPTVAVLAAVAVAPPRQRNLQRGAAASISRWLVMKRNWAPRSRTSTESQPRFCT